MAEGFVSLSAIEVSSDLWRLYIADSSKGCIYAAAICEYGSLRDIKIFAVLHMSTDFTNPGAYDICVDCNDRVFAATEMGVQCIQSYGLIDIILPLPQNEIPQRLTINDGCLYAECGEKSYKRKTLHIALRTYKIFEKNRERRYCHASGRNPSQECQRHCFGAPLYHAAPL